MSTASIDPEPPVQDVPAGTDRRLVIAATGFAVAGLGVPFGSGFLQVRLVAAGSGDYGDIVWYAAAAAPIVSLLVLRQFPVRGWAWLLTSGAVLTLPLPLSILDRELFEGASVELIATPVVIGGTTAFLGVLGAAAWVRTQSATMGTALGSVSITVPVAGTFVLFSVLFGRLNGDGGWLFVTLAALALVGSIGALVVTSFLAEANPARPSWRLIACGSFVALLPLCTLWIDEKSQNYLLVIGLVTAVPALLAALVAGWRIGIAALLAAVITAAAADASLLGFAFRTSAASGWIVLPLALVALAVGWLLATSRWRALVGIIGLIICGLALLMSEPYSTFDARPSGSETAIAIAVAMIGIIAVMSAIASVIGSLTEPAQLPATFGALSIAIQSGLGPILTYLVTRQRARSANDETATTILGLALLVAVAGLLALAVWQLRRTPPLEPEADQSSSVTSRLPSA